MKSCVYILVYTSFMILHTVSEHAKCATVLTFNQKLQLHGNVGDTCRCTCTQVYIKKVNHYQELLYTMLCIHQYR